MRKYMNAIVTKYEETITRSSVVYSECKKIEYSSKCRSEGVCEQCDDVLKEVVLVT
jgi:hypothetical protein